METNFYFDWDKEKAKVIERDNDRFVWQGEKRGYWTWNRTLRSSLQRSGVAHWIDQSYNLLEYPVDAFFRIDAMNAGDDKQISGYERQYREMTIGAQKIMGLMRDSLGSINRSTVEAFFQDVNQPITIRIINALEALHQEYIEFPTEVA